MISPTPGIEPLPLKPGSATFPLPGVDAAVGTLMALNYRQMTGEGQYVDISMQRSMFHSMFDTVLWWAGNKAIIKRHGSDRARGNIIAKQVWPCKDGYVNFFYFAGPWSIRANRGLVEWMDSEGYATDYLKQIDWDKFDWAKLTQDEVDRLEEPTAKFFMDRTKAELYEKAVELHIMLYPVYTTEDLMKDKQLSSRNYWVDVGHDELDTVITYPGAWVRATETPIEIRRRAPTIGEHNWDIYVEELGFSEEELIALEGNGII